MDLGYYTNFPRNVRYITEDSGTRVDYGSGMVRDVQDNKARFDLLLPEGVSYDDQFLVRCALLLSRGAAKYSERNWEKATGKEELDRFKASAFRHLIQWLTEDTPQEDHAAAVVFNLLGAETVKGRMKLDE